MLFLNSHFQNFHASPKTAYLLPVNTTHTNSNHYKRKFEHRKKTITSLVITNILQKKS